MNCDGMKMNLLLSAKNETAFHRLVSHYNATKEVPRQLPQHDKNLIKT
jgi:hypothetical protein